MAGNPLVDQGVLNRLVASVSFTDFPALNVTPSFLGKEAITMALEGDIVTYIPTMTGGVTSPEPYQLVSVTIHLLKTQSLAAAFKSQIESSALLGACVVRPDTKILPPYDLVNCSIYSGPRELNFAGMDAGWVIMIRGYYEINADLWSQ